MRITLFLGVALILVGVVMCFTRLLLVGILLIGAGIILAGNDIVRTVKKMRNK